MNQITITKPVKGLVPKQAGEIILASGLDGLLAKIRPAWQAKSLIGRVKKLLPADPSSACQRLLNAAIHDLRDKIVIAGLDVAKEVAASNKLPPVTKAEDVQDYYSTTHTLELAYRMGLMSRAEWRRLKRAYEIRKDLEHEDDEYEAGLEDCVYVFSTCIEIVLSRDPITPVGVTDAKEIVESPSKIAVSNELIEDFANAPGVRQLEIAKFLMSTARDPNKTDIVRQNAVEMLHSLRARIHKGVQAQLGEYVQALLKNKPIGLVDMKIAAASGITPYLKQAKAKEFFNAFAERVKKVSYRWSAHTAHQKVFDDLEDFGGLEAMPQEVRQRIVLWMVKCYIGEEGGYGMGVNRPVFYSDVAAPRIRTLFKVAGPAIEAEFEKAAAEKHVNAAIKDKHIARRLEMLRDLVSPTD